jgi:hypothetical protein
LFDILDYQSLEETMQETTKQLLAIAALTVGIINLCAWFVPICGIPLAMVGLILGALGVQSRQRGLAVAGIVLSGFGLLASIVGIVIGIIMWIPNFLSIR